MATVAYEISTRVQKSFAKKVFRGYRFRAQLLISDMTERNFHQLKLPVSGDSVTIPVREFIETVSMFNKQGLKAAIRARMDAIKVKYEKQMAGEATRRASVKLASGGVFKDKLL